MKVIAAISLCSLIALSSTTFADDQNCEKLKDNSSQACTCIIDNSVNDCLAHSGIKQVCTKARLDNYFKTNSNGAQAQCVKYTNNPARCEWSVDYYLGRPTPAPYPSPLHTKACPDIS